MREFTFRVWDKKNSRFLEHWDGNISFDLWRWTQLMSTCLTFPINDYIIQQFTGLIDSYGVDIYEGDVVEWKSFEGTLHCEPVTFDNGLFWVDLPLYEVNEVCKVRGNIFNANIK